MDIHRWFEQNEYKVSISGWYYTICPDCSKEGYMKKKLYMSPDKNYVFCFRCGKVFYKGKIMSYNKEIIIKDMSDIYNSLKQPNDVAIKHIKNKCYKINHELIEFKVDELNNIYFPIKLYDSIVGIIKRDIKTGRYIYYGGTKVFYSIKDGYSKTLFFVEGIFDLWALYSVLKNRGDSNIIALLSNRLTWAQRLLLGQYVSCDELYIWLDEQRLSLALYEQLLGLINFDRCYILVADKDPCDTIKENNKPKKIQVC